MSSDTKSKQEEYISKLKDLYSRVGMWIESRDLKISRTTIELDEEVLGRYEAPILTILDAQGKKAADLLPIGAQIIGAEGRVDLVGSLDREALLYLTEGGPQFKTKVTERGAPEEARSTPLFRGAEEAGWYWIERFRPARAHRLAEELFLDLLSEISDYDA